MNLSIIVKIKYYDKHLYDCIKGILSLNLTNYELIFVSEKHNTQIDVFLLNILNKYSNNKNIIVVQEKDKNFNNIVNKAIKVSSGKYIHILDQNTLVLENTYFEFVNLQEEFNYDVYVFDYITITKDIDYSEVYKKHNKNILKIKNKNKNNNKKYVKNLKESGLVFDFSKFSKKKQNNYFIKTKGFKYNTSNLYEFIQRLDSNYKIELLSILDIQEYSIIFKKELLLGNVFLFPNEIDSSLEIYERLLLIKSISCIKNTNIYYYENKIDDKNTLKKSTIDIEEIVSQSKSKYKQIIERCKRDPQSYIKSFDLIEYIIFLELFNFSNKKYQLNKIDKQYYLNEIYKYLINLLPNFKKNKYFNKSIYSKIKFELNKRKLEKYLQKDLKQEKKKREESKKLKEKQRKENKDKKKELEKQKTKSKEKKSIKSKKEKDVDYKKVEQKRIEYKNTKENNKTKKKRNVFKVLARKISFDINKIKRTRFNKNLSKVFKSLKNKTQKFFGLIKEILKKIKTKLFKKKVVKTLYITEQKVLLLDSPKKMPEAKKQKDLKTKNKTKNKTKSKKIKDKR